MNNSLKKIIAFISASFVIGLLIFLFSGRGIVDDEFVIDSFAVKEFKLKCDSLRFKKWDQEKYKNLNSALVAMNAQEIFNAQEVSNIKIYLNQAYAKTLKDSCASWLTTSGDDCDRQLFSEMQLLAKNSECSKMLSSEIQTMNAYFSALQIPGKIRSFIQSNYTLEKYNSLISEINSTAKNTEIKNFSSMKKVATNGISELNDFQKYSNNFEGAYDYFLKNNGEGNSVDYLKALCPANNNSKPYVYYFQKLNSLVENLCETL